MPDLNHRHDREDLAAALRMAARYGWQMTEAAGWRREW